MTWLGLLSLMLGATECGYTHLGGKLQSGNGAALFDASGTVASYNQGYFYAYNEYVEFETQSNFYLWIYSSVYEVHNGTLKLFKYDTGSASWIDTGQLITRQAVLNTWTKNDFIIPKGRYKVTNPSGPRIDTEWYFELASSGKFLFEGSDNKVYTYSSNQFTELGSSPASASMFDSNGLDDIAGVPINSFPTSQFRLLSKNKNTTSTLLTVPKQKYSIIKTNAITLGDCENIDTMTLTGSSTNNSKVRVMVSTDGNSFYSLKNNIWESYTLNKANMLMYGMTLNEFNAINTNMNNLNYKTTNKMYLAFYMELDSINDTLAVDKFEYQFDVKGTWKQVTLNTTYESTIVSNNTLSIKIIDPGTYKVNY